MLLEVKFDRLGRTHNPPSMCEDIDTCHPGIGATVLARRIYDHARRFCASRTIEVVVDLDEDGQGEGTVYAGFHVAGSFTVGAAEVSEGRL